METEFSIQSPHEEALALLKGKPVVSREVFDGMLPELRNRVFTVTGVEGANVLQRVRDAVAGIAEGDNWDEAKKAIADELDPYLGDGAVNRAELILRTNGFQAFQASAWRTAQGDEQTTHLQYLTMEDDRVRASHAALDGIVLPKDDPFWQKHFPPWEWGCRCMTRTMSEDQVEDEKAADEKRNPEDQNILAGPVRKQLENGTLMRSGQRFDVTAPVDKPGGDSAFSWHPDNLRLPVEDLKARYDKPVWDAFESWAKEKDMATGLKGKKKKGSIWDWLNETPTKVNITDTLTEADQVADGLEKAGFDDSIVELGRALPEKLAGIANKAVFKAIGGGAHYTRSTRTISLNRDPENWNGLPFAFYHELGHHVHYELGIVGADGLASPEFEMAIQRDSDHWVKSAKSASTDWQKLWDARYPMRSIERAAEIFGMPPNYQWKDELNARVLRFTDTVMGLSRGKYGAGHKPKYMTTNGAKEVFANALSAIMEGDKEYMAAFPTVVAFIRKELNL